MCVCACVCVCKPQPCPKLRCVRVCVCVLCLSVCLSVLEFVSECLCSYVRNWEAKRQLLDVYVSFFLALVLLLPGSHFWWTQNLSSD